MNLIDKAKELIASLAQTKNSSFGIKVSLKISTTEPDYDEGCDGEWHYICDVTTGIYESLSDYCPNCGTNMDGII